MTISVQTFKSFKFTWFHCSTLYPSSLFNKIWSGRLMDNQIESSVWVYSDSARERNSFYVIFCFFVELLTKRSNIDSFLFNLWSFYQPCWCMWVSCWIKLPGQAVVQVGVLQQPIQLGYMFLLYFHDLFWPCLFQWPVSFSLQL